MTDAYEPLGVTSANRIEWLKARRAGIGGSDAAVVLGLSPYKSALELYVEKTATSDPIESEEDRHFLGNAFEPGILALYHRKTKRMVKAGGQLLRSRAYPWMQVTLDASQESDGPQWAAGPGVVEVKSYDLKVEHEVPVHVQMQVQHEMLVTGYTWGSALWLEWRTLKWEDLRAHDAFQELLIEETGRFWTDHVLKRVPPPPDRTESSKRALSLLYPGVEDVAVLLDEGPDWATAYEEACGDEKDAQYRKAELSNRFKATMGNARYMLIGDGRYLSRSSVPARDDYCENCNCVIGHRSAYTAVKLLKPRKKPLPAPVETRVLREAVPDLAAQLRESLEQREET